MLVSFSGIDGAGKSTQINKLCIDLLGAGRRVDLLTFWDNVATLKNLRERAAHEVFGGDKGIGAPDAPILRRDKNVQTGFMTLARLGLYFADALSLRRVVKKAMRSGAEIVIFDRYILDELVNLNLRNPFARLYLQLIWKFSPRPDVAFLLDADPVAARARKPEYPLEFLRVNRDAYLTFARIAPGVTVIPPLPPDEVGAKVAKCVGLSSAFAPVEVTQVRPVAVGESARS